MSEIFKDKNILYQTGNLQNKIIIENQSLEFHLMIGMFW